MLACVFGLLGVLVFERLEPAGDNRLGRDNDGVGALVDPHLSEPFEYGFDGGSRERERRDRGVLTAARFVGDDVVDSVVERARITARFPARIMT